MDQITTYATLQSAVAGMIHRPGVTSITDNIPLFIQLLEAELNDRLILKNSESDETLTLTQDQNYVALPSGFVSPIAMWLIVDSQRVPLQWALTKELPYYTDSTQPSVCAIDGANIRFDCPADQAYSARLRCVKTSNLSVSNTTNYLLLKRPDVYLFGTLEQVSLWTKDDNDALKWGAKKEAAIKSLKAAESRGKGIVHLRSDFGHARANITRGE